MMDVAFSVQEANVKLEKVGYAPFLESTYPGLDMLQRLLLETSVHGIFDQFQAKGFKCTGNKRQFPQTIPCCCCLSMIEFCTSRSPL